MSARQSHRTRLALVAAGVGLLAALAPAQTQELLAAQPGEFYQGGPNGPSIEFESAPTQASDPFARPVEETITQEIIEQTDLSEQGSSIIGQIFQSEEQIRRLLGENVAFIYRSGNRRDPMIIPWIRRECDRSQLLATGQAAEQGGDVAAALEAYRTLRESYSGSREAGLAEEAIARLEAQLAPTGTSLGANAAQPAAVVTLPMEISGGLSGIIGSPGSYNCLIGSEIYAEGDKIPNFDVTVVEIRPDAVVFEYHSQQFTVPMVSN